MATVKGETAALPHQATESEGERLARRRRNEETKEELRRIQAMKRVSLHAVAKLKITSWERSSCHSKRCE